MAVSETYGARWGGGGGGGGGGGTHQYPSLSPPPPTPTVPHKFHKQPWTFNPFPCCGGKYAPYIQ